MFTKRLLSLSVLLALLICIGLTLPALADDTTPSITLDKTAVSLSVDATEQLTATIKKGGLASDAHTWESDNDSIATVDNTGKIQAVAVGIANVTISFDVYPTVKATCRVEVTSNSSIKLNVSSVTLDIGNKFVILPDIKPAAIAGTASYSSSNTAICTVDSTGEVTAVAPGTATIIVANAHGVKAYCTVIVPGSAVTPTPTPTPTGSIITPTAGPLTGIPAFVNTVKGSLNLRVAPSTGATILRTIPENAPFTVLEYGSTWCKAYYNGTIGYVMTKFVRLAGTVPTGIPYVTPTPTPIPTGAPVVQFKARVSTPSGSLNLRTNPWQSAPRILTIPRNTIIDVLQSGSSWSYVRYGAFEGYVMSKFLSLVLSPDPSPITPTTPPYTQKAIVNTVSGGLNMRKSPSSGSRRITVIPQFAEVQVIQTGTKWCYVSYNGRSGYVMTKFLNII